MEQVSPLCFLAQDTSADIRVHGLEGESCDKSVLVGPYEKLPETGDLRIFDQSMIANPDEKSALHIPSSLTTAVPPL